MALFMPSGAGPQSLLSLPSTSVQCAAEAGTFLSRDHTVLVAGGNSPDSTSGAIYKAIHHLDDFPVDIGNILIVGSPLHVNTEHYLVRVRSIIERVLYAGGHQQHTGCGYSQNRYISSCFHSLPPFY